MAMLNNQIVYPIIIHLYPFVSLPTNFVAHLSICLFQCDWTLTSVENPEADQPVPGILWPM